ncbi:hypothetical protein FBD94_00190 [Pedobacter hiemivivus]|uniref:Uncharacterized protein n=1 Tax=Pedobacter hiemivivus TaxID=2530454 RepID=A0A4U1GKV9_9SPHI|nr:hypothetical protein [Pedobacter hiemivivus]TKC65017.1 hypothetical protein FBD94_00190 [Pedobacter hiemivivus]
MNVNTFAILLIILLAGCDFKNENTPLNQKTVPKEKSDTIVGIEVVPAVISGMDYIEKEYFVVIKNDTSSFSGTVIENKATGKVSIGYRRDPYERTPRSFSSDDTAAVAYDEPLKKPAKKLNCKDQMRQIELILSYASMDFNLSKSHSLRFAMSAIDGFSQNIAKQYLSKYGEKFPYGGNKNAAELVKSSRLTAALNKALAPYSLIIDKVSIDGLGYTRAQHAQDNARLDGMVYWSVKKR